MASLDVVDHKRSYLPNEMKLARNELYSSCFFLLCKSIDAIPGKEKKETCDFVINIAWTSTSIGQWEKAPCHDSWLQPNKKWSWSCATMHQQIYCLSDKWLMVVFFNMIDIAAINVMTIWLSQNPNWGGNCTHIRRLFLLGWRESLTTAHNDRRSQQSLRIRFEIAHASVSNSKR